MRITALLENTSACGLPCEHGLSLYIETGERTVLFDAGQTALFAENASRLGLDLSRVDLMVLSHGHYDHGGGLRRFLQINREAPVYVHRGAFEPHYNGTEKYIGLDVSLRDSGRIIFTDGETRIADGLTLYDFGDNMTADERSCSGLNRMRDGVMEPDDFSHEQYLMMESGGRRVLISGCSHKGVLNIMSRFEPDVMIGGFHLSKIPPGDELRAYAERLNAFDTDYYTCHCTGEEQYRYMRRCMERLRYLSAGDSIDL